MSKIMQDLIKQYVEAVKKIYGSHVRQIILYGSYARGDYTDSSDVDVMILVKIPEDQIRDYTDRVSDCAFENLMKYGVDISPVVKNEAHFNEWSDNLPYYRNVRDEGVIINAG